MPDSENTASTAPQSDADRRESLRQRIESGEARNEARRLADQARDVADSAFDYAKKNPIKVVAGAVAAGLLIGAMTRPGRRLGKRGGALAAFAVDAALAYGLKAFKEAGNAGESLAENARGLGTSAAYKLDMAGDAVRSGSRKAGQIGARAMRDMRSRFTH